MTDNIEDVNHESVEKEARNLGWVPQDQFKGNPDHWVDADEFVKRGQSLMPLLVSNNKRLQQELLTRDAKIGTLEINLQNANTAIEKLEKHYTEANKRAVETAKQNLKQELRQAREDNDVDAEERILGKLGDIQQRERDEAAAAAANDDKKKTASVNDNNQLPPEMQAWYAENSWFGGTSKEDRQKTKEVSRIAEDLRDDGNTLIGRAFMEECMRVWEDRQDPVDPPLSKVESPTARGSRSGGDKSFSSLPKEAKEACWSDNDDLVGPDKRYKTQKEWEAAYAKIYYSGE